MPDKQNINTDIIGSVGSEQLTSSTVGSLQQQVRVSGRPDTQVQGPDYAQVSKTPQTMIRIGVGGSPVGGSTVTDFEEYLTCFDNTGAASKLTNPDQSGPLYSSSQNTFTDWQVVIPYGAHLTSLYQYMWQGIKAEDIIITRLGTINETNIHMQDHTFLNCYFQKIVESHEKIILTFKFAAIMLTVFEYGQDGSLLGQTETGFDTTTGKLLV